MICHENVGKETAVFVLIAVNRGFVLIVLPLNCKEFSLTINLSISRSETRKVRFFHFCLSTKLIKSVASLRCDFCDFNIGCSIITVSTKEEILSVRPSDD